MSRYAAKIENDLVVQVIRGDADWAADRLGGVWLPSEEKVGRGWEEWQPGLLRPPAPFPSWTWNGSAWQPPTPKPDGDFVWDEAAGQWVAGETL